MDVAFTARIELSRSEKNKLNIINMVWPAHLVTADKWFARSFVDLHKHEKDISRISLETNFLNQPVVLKFPPTLQTGTSDNGNLQNPKEIDRISDKPTIELPNFGPSYVQQYGRRTDYGDQNNRATFRVLSEIKSLVVIFWSKLITHLKCMR